MCISPVIGQRFKGCSETMIQQKSRSMSDGVLVLNTSTTACEGLDEVASAKVGKPGSVDCWRL